MHAWATPLPPHTHTAPVPRLNWQLHFGETPKWARGVKFILVDPAPDARDRSLAAVVLQGDAAAVAKQLAEGLGSHGLDGNEAVKGWRQQLHEKVCGGLRIDGFVLARVGGGPVHCRSMWKICFGKHRCPRKLHMGQAADVSAAARCLFLCPGLQAVHATFFFSSRCSMHKGSCSP